MTRILSCTVLLGVTLAAVACSEPSEPALLDHAQILAVRATPPHVAPGGRARIDMLAGDYAGSVFEAQPESVTAQGLAVEHADDGWYVTATVPGIVPIDVALTIDGELWRAEKQLVVAQPADNPRVATMQVDGAAAATELVAQVGTKPALAAVGEGMEPLSYAWYSSVGDLEHYRKPEATLDAKAAAQGTIVVVVRDRVGGVDWHVLPARVE
jgi:hypothetical protein